MALVPQSLEAALQKIANNPASVLHGDVTSPLPTGNPVIDAEHLWLYDMLQQALCLCPCHAGSCNACQTGRPQQCMDETTYLIGSILKSMVDHFRDEEALFRRESAYDRMESHLSAHIEIARWMGQLVEDYRDEDTARCLGRLIYILHHWLQQHITDYDLPFFAAFPTATVAGLSPARSTAD